MSYNGIWKDAMVKSTCNYPYIVTGTNYKFGRYTNSKKK